MIRFKRRLLPFPWIYLGLVAVCLLSTQSQAQKIDMSELADSSSLGSIAEKIFGKNVGNKLFYFPTKDQPYTPEKYGYKYEDVFFKSLDGSELHGWFMPSTKGVAQAKGTVVFSHGNTGSLGHHLGFVDWFMRENYNVLIYDYRGFGKSKGKITRKGLIEDVQAAFSYVKTRKDIDQTKLISYSHSLGGAKSIVALALKPVTNLRAVIVHGGFASYREMAEDKAGKLGASITSDELSAIEYVDKISPVPLFFVHGEEDEVVPLSQGLKLYEKAQMPKTLVRVPGGNHVNSLRVENKKYREQLLSWLDKVIR